MLRIGYCVSQQRELLPDFLNDIIKYIESTQVAIDGEWGDGRTLEELINDKEMPKLYHDLIDLKNGR